MKLKPNHKGLYFAHLTGSSPINLDTKDRVVAKRLAKAAKLEDIEFAAKAKLLTTEAIQRLTSDSRITGGQALEKWRDLAGTKLGLSPTTLHGYEANIRRFLVLTKLADKPITAPPVGRGPAVAVTVRVVRCLGPDRRLTPSQAGRPPEICCGGPRGTR